MRPAHNPIKLIIPIIAPIGLTSRGFLERDLLQNLYLKGPRVEPSCAYQYNSYKRNSTPMQPSKKYSWQNRRQYVSQGRMTWYGESSDEQYWYNYWKARLNTAYYAAAQQRNLANDELGKVLLKEMRSDGLHLEAGCGAGYWVTALTYHGLEVEGIEYAHNLVELVNSINPQLPICQGDALSIGHPDNYYDSYLSFGVVEHRVEGPEPFLCEAYRVLKPGGKILISVPFFGPIRALKNRLSLYDQKRPELPFFQYGFSRKEFTTYLERAGFSIETVRALYVDRLLIEELPLYRWLAFQRRSKLVKRWAEKLLENKDGHMLLVVGTKPPP